MLELHLNNLPSLSVFLLIIAGIDLFFAVIAFVRRRAVGAGSFLLLMLAMGVYAGGYAFELASSDLTTALFFSNVQYLGIPFVAFLLYSLIWKYLRHTNAMPLKLVIPLLIVPVVTFFCHLTCDGHNLFYINPQLGFYNGLSILSFEKGIWKHIDHAYTFSLVIMALIHCIVRFIKDEKYRSHIALLIAATVFPFGGFLLYVAGLAPEHLDITPLTFGLSCPFLAIAIFHLSLFDIVPVARDHIFENLDNGLLVTDSLDRLIDYNKSIIKIFPELEKFRVGVSVKSLAVINGGRTIDLYQLLNTDKTFVAEQGGGRRIIIVYEKTSYLRQDSFTVE